MLVRKLAEMGADISVHDPYVKHWWEFEKQDTYPVPGHSWSRFFRNQENLKALTISKDMTEAVRGADAVVLAVRHEQYLRLSADNLLEMTANVKRIKDEVRSAQQKEQPLSR
jgi:UDP-N-acetyl-D-mannosaminuronate dehydrogenase